MLHMFHFHRREHAVESVPLHPAILDFLMRQSYAVAVLQRQVDELSRRIAKYPQPTRPNWQRHSAPSWERETITVPRLPAPKRPPRPVSLVNIPRITRVTIRLDGEKQYVIAYDAGGHAIPGYCGEFREVGLKVLEVAGRLTWEVEAA